MAQMALDLALKPTTTTTAAATTEPRAGQLREIVLRLCVRCGRWISATARSCGWCREAAGGGGGRGAGGGRSDGGGWRRREEVAGDA